MSRHLTQWLCTVAGVRKDAQAQVPKALGLASTTGGLLVLISAAAAGAFGFAVWKALAGHAHALVVALITGPAWGTLIFCVDRALVLGIDKLAPFWRQLSMTLARAPFAVVIGFVISKPVVLAVSGSLLDYETRKTQRAVLRAEVEQNAQLEGLPSKQRLAASAASARDSVEVRLQGVPDSYDYHEAKAAADAATATAQRVERVNNPRIAGVQAEINRLAAEADSAQNRAALEAAQRQRSTLRSEIARARTAADLAQRKADSVAGRWYRAGQQKLSVLDSVATVAAHRADSAGARVNAQNSKSDEALDALFRPNLINEYTTLKRIQRDPKHAHSATMRAVEMGLDGLFVMLELSVLILKLLARIGPLDHTVRALELEDQERVTNAVNAATAKLQAESQAKEQLYQKLWVALTHHYDSRLKHTALTRTEIIDMLKEVDQLGA